MSHKAYNTNYLISVSRLPHHFFGMINDLQGKEALYHNPGIALRSFVIANCFNDEFVEVDGTMQSVIEECEEFSNSHNMIALIIDMLKSKYNEAKGLVEADDFKNTVKDTLDRSTMLFKNMNSSYDQFMDYCSNVPPEVNSITTTPGTYLKHSMFEFKNVLDQLVYEVSLVPSNESA